MDTKAKSRIINLIENNIATFLATWKDFEGADFLDDQTGIRIASGLPFSYTNSVIKSYYSKNIEEEFQKTIEPFIAMEVPVLWWVGPNTKPDNLGNFLEEKEFRKASEPPGMHMNLNDLDPNYQFPPELSIKLVKEEYQIEDIILP